MLVGRLECEPLGLLWIAQVGHRTRK
jgi:hypothetical protein